jgi:LDH2 family malate/lactate/ureidoglycolate dehydrogenase
MPTKSPEQLSRLVDAAFQKLGATPDDAGIVARHMVGANLAGHDSHGVILLPTYVERVGKGDIVLDAPFEIVDDTATTARIDGHWGLGQVVSERAMFLAMEKAKRHNIAAVTVMQQSHVGRVADYPLMAARDDLIAFMFADSGRTAKPVAPFGGREGRLGTNPICIALPSDLEAPVFIDMATSAIAANKLGVYRNRKQSIPEGWIVDKDGNASTDPNAYYAGGTLLPLGGSQGHKGFGLAFMVETFAGILTGLGFGLDPAGRHNDGTLMICLNPAAFQPLDKFKRQVAELAMYVKETPKAAGVQEIYYPGELELLTEKRRRREGIPVEEQTWASLVATAEKLGIGALVA